MTFEGKYCTVLVPLTQTQFAISELEITRARKLNSTELEVRMQQIKNVVSIMLGLNDIVGLDISNTKERRESFSETSSATLAVCIPKACSISQVVEYLQEEFIFPNFQYTDFYCRTSNDKTVGVAEYTAIVIFGLIFILIIVSTFYDLNYSLIQKKETKSDGALYRSFSLYTNTARLLTFNKTLNSIECLDGIRAISMFWVIVGHTYSYTTVGFVQNQLYILEWMQSFWSLWITSAPYAVDTFFTISGLLVVYTVLCKMSITDFVKGLHIYVLHRLLRMFPLLAATILLQVSLFYHLADGPYWFRVSSMTENCKENWWVTLLHLQNNVRRDKMCLEHTWYLAVDTQLYVMASLVLLFLFGGRKKGAAILALAMAISLGICVGYSFVNNFPASIINAHLDYFRLYYINTITRSPPFVAGMVFGYVLHLYRNKPVRIPKTIARICWLLSLGILGSIFFGMHPLNQFDYRNELVENLVNGFARFLWAVSLGWIVLACHHGYGGPVNWFLTLDMWKLPSRLSYAMYLIHTPLIIVVNSTWTHTKYFSNGDTIYRYLSNVLMTMLASFGLSLIVDAPFSTLQKLFMDYVGGKKDRYKEKDKKTSVYEIDHEKKINGLA